MVAFFQIVSMMRPKDMVFFMVLCCKWKEKWLTQQNPATQWGQDIPRDRPLRIVFMGTPDFAVPSLQALIDSPHEILRVITQPDRGRGRGRKVKPTPVKAVALEAGLPVFQPQKMTSPEALEALKSDAPDLAVVIAYGKILRPRILAVPPLGCINCHASLLPSYRGAAPIYWAVRNGEAETGVTTMLMDDGMDTGPELLKRSISIAPDETVGSIHDRLAALSASLLMETLSKLLDGDLAITTQQHENATYAPMLSKEENWIDFNNPCLDVHNKIRALDPFPGARCLLPSQQQLKLFGSSLAPEASGEPGEVVEASGSTVTIACAEGGVTLSELQAPGRKRMPTQAFLAGQEFPVGTRLSTPAQITKEDNG